MRETPLGASYDRLNVVDSPLTHETFVEGSLETKGAPEGFHGFSSRECLDTELKEREN